MPLAVVSAVPLVLVPASAVAPLKHLAVTRKSAVSWVVVPWSVPGSVRRVKRSCVTTPPGGVP